MHIIFETGHIFKIANIYSIYGHIIRYTVIMIPLTFMYNIIHIYICADICARRYM